LQIPDLIDGITIQILMRPGMRRWFLSYTSHDFALVQALKNGLQRKDTNAAIFFAPESMRTGGFWLPQLAKEIAEQLHWLITDDPASEATIGKLIDAASRPATRPAELWRYTRPYCGLEAMTEANSDFFFGREQKTVDVINALAVERGKLPVLLGNSGVGKSSLARAGVLAALLRQGFPEHVANGAAWPAVLHDSRRWCFLTVRPGTEPVRALVEPFIKVWQFDATDPRREERLNEWADLLKSGGASLRGLLNATQDRLGELGQPTPPSFLLYVDQGEELYVRAEKEQRRRFSEVVAAGLTDPRLRVLMSLRADFFGELQKDEPLFAVHRLINVPPLREIELREIVSNPAKLLSAHFQTDTLAVDIARRTAEESVEDAGALPLLSYLLDDMWSEMVERGDGVLRLPMQAIDLGRVLVERANKFVMEHPGMEDALRRVLTLKLATVREDGEPTRRRAARSEFTDEEWRLVSELADHPNRLLVTATPEAGETYAEVAHEAIFRRWDKLRDWIAAEREFLAWRTGLEAARRSWQAASDSSKSDALLMGAALTQAQSWRAKRAADFPAIDLDFIKQSTTRESRARARTRRVRTLVYVLLVGIILGLIVEINRAYVEEQANWYWIMRPYRVANFDPYVLKPETERTLKPGDPFRECAKDCPEMVVVPAGEFVMGSPASEKGRYNAEGPQHKVMLAKPFAVAKFDVTSADWDACVSVGGCPQEGRAGDAGWGRGTRPVIYVSWDDAKWYVAWFSRMTGKAYRLLTEAEFEYAARAGTETAYPWGDDIGKDNANCNGCGSQWDSRQTAPVDSFKPNRFGLYQMVGNVWKLLEDCYHENYNGAPADGSAWTSGDCKIRVIRGGSWNFTQETLRSANRGGYASGNRDDFLGFRVARTLDR
jgi:formylglycine-generating enzyme required for sulfatase activity